MIILSTAGSETTATYSSCVTYYLLRTPKVMRDLREEIDTAFKSYEEINASSASSLKYSRALHWRVYRLYARLPFPLPHVVPEGEDTVDGQFLPAGVSFS